MKIRIILIFLVCSCCNKQNSITTPDQNYSDYFSDSNFIYSNPKVSFSNQRLIFIHGCVDPGANHINCLMNTPAYSALVDSLSARGVQTILFDLPDQGKIKNEWNDGGVKYAKAFLSKLTQSISWAEKENGHSDNYYIGGISYGGIHAIYGAEHLNYFKKYFAILPLMKINLLSEFSNDSAPYFDATVNYQNLFNQKGLLAWNTTDTRVGYKETEKLCTNLNGMADSVVYNSGGHSITGDLNYVVKFLEK